MPSAGFGQEKEKIKTKKTDRNMNILDTEQMGRYRAYLEEYKGYYANAQSDEERNEILRKVEELCQAEFGVPANKLYVMGWNIDYDLGKGEQELMKRERQQNKPTQDIKSLKIVVMILAAIVIYLLARR